MPEKTDKKQAQHVPDRQDSETYPATTSHDLRANSRIRTVAMADVEVTRCPHDTLAAYALGASIAVCMYDPANGTAGLLHALLPSSQSDPEKAGRAPATYVDSGIPLLLDHMFELGTQPGRIVARLVGAVRHADGTQIYSTGQKNHTVARKILWKNDILIDGEAVGGAQVRTAFLYAATGQCGVRTEHSEILI